MLPTVRGETGYDTPYLLASSINIQKHPSSTRSSQVTSLPSRYCSGQMMLNFGVQMGTDLAKPQPVIKMFQAERTSLWQDHLRYPSASAINTWHPAKWSFRSFSSPWGRWPPSWWRPEWRRAAARWRTWIQSGISCWVKLTSRVRRHNKSSIEKIPIEKSPKLNNLV